jgi:hypothetical protein
VYPVVRGSNYVGITALAESNDLVVFFSENVTERIWSYRHRSSIGLLDITKYQPKRQFVVFLTTL